MKLSVCIPVLNFDVRELIFELKREIKEHAINAEIILIDDASNDQFKTINREIRSQVNTFIFLEKNIGRSKIRNLFSEYAQGDYLLFLDCDGKIITPTFLSAYIEYLKSNPRTEVVYGGRIVSKNLPDRKYILRWKFAAERENLTVIRRIEKPYLSFQTNNFIVKKEIFATVQFNPDFEKYGYEDLLFAMDLKSDQIAISHIENPIFNNDLETNAAYLKKAEESVESLADMMKKHSLRLKISEIKLVSAYNFISKTYSNYFFLLLFSLIENILKKNLLSDNPNLRNLDFYKLGLLLRKMK